jgi:hypothetical protein
LKSNSREKALPLLSALPSAATVAVELMSLRRFSLCRQLLPVMPFHRTRGTIVARHHTPQPTRLQSATSLTGASYGNCHG